MAGLHFWELRWRAFARLMVPRSGRAPGTLRVGSPGGVAAHSRLQASPRRLARP